MQKKEEITKTQSNEQTHQEHSLLTYVSGYNYLSNLRSKFDNAFITLLLVQYLNQGLSQMISLSTQDYFKQKLHLDPGVMTGYMSIIAMPWSIKICYGFISDNVPIAGTRRKSYVVLMGLTSFTVLSGIFYFEIKSGFSIAILLACQSVTMAFCKVVTDAIMVVQARNDPVHGSQELFSLAQIASGVGGVTGCVVGGLLTERGIPQYSYLIQSLMGLSVALIGTTLSKECEEEQNEDENALEIREEETFMSKLSENASQIGKAIQMPEIYMVLIFFVANGIMSPSFGQFSYFFMLDVCKVTKFQFAMFGVISRACHILGSMYYKSFLKDVETRTIILYSTIMSVLSTFIHYVLAMRWNHYLGISDLVFIIFTDVVFGCLIMAMLILPTMALFAKITPPGVEATIFAFLTGTWNFADGVLSPMVGAWLNKTFGGVTAKDLSNYHNLCLMSFLFSFLGFIILPLIPLKADIERVQQERLLEKQKLLKKEETESQPQEEEEEITVEGYQTKFKKAPVNGLGPLGDMASATTRLNSSQRDDEEEQERLLQE